MGCNASTTVPPSSSKKGYVYGFFDLKNPEEFKNVYSPMAEPTLTPYGGKFIMKHALAPPLAAKLGMKESKGFGTTGQMAFMLEFPSFEKAMGWFTGPEYAAVIAKRDEVSDFKMAVVEGEAITPGAGLVVGFFDLKNPEEFKTVYSPMAEPTLTPYGGKFVIKHALAPPLAAKMGMKESKGFGTTGQMAFTLMFPSFEKAMGWFTGPEYAAVIAKRDEVSDFKMAVVQSTPPAAAAPVLTYLPIAARGETARMICKVGGLEFVDNACMQDDSIKKIDYFSPSGTPLLKHGELQIAQSLPIEAYLSRIAPKYAKLTAQQRAIDGVVCAIKEDVCVAAAGKMFGDCKDGEEVKTALSKWYAVVEGKCPEKGFFNGLEFPTAADLACVTMCEGYMPFGACQKQAGLGVTDLYKTFPKFSSLVKRTMEYPTVAEYLKTNTTLKMAAMGK